MVSHGLTSLGAWLLKISIMFLRRELCFQLEHFQRWGGKWEEGLGSTSGRFWGVWSGRTPALVSLYGALSSRLHTEYSLYIPHVLVESVLWASSGSPENILLLALLVKSLSPMLTKT